jgi:AraC-like DNA-binding protein
MAIPLSDANVLPLNVLLAIVLVHQTGIFSLLLFFNSASNKSRIWLGTYLLVYTLVNFYFILISASPLYTTPFVLNSFVLFYPLTSLSIVIFYIYITKITGKAHRLMSFALHSILPMLILIIISVFYIPLPPSEKQNVITNLLSTRLEVEEGGFNILWHAAIMIITLQFLVYTILITLKVRKSETLLENYYSYKENISLKWLKYIIIYIIVSYPLYFIFGNINDLYFNTQMQSVYFFNQVIITFLIGFFGLRQRSQGAIIQNQGKMNSQVLTNQSKKDKERLFNELETMMREHKIFLNNDLTINKLAKDLNTNRYYLSSVIKEYSGLNFCNYTNKQRVDEFLARYKHDDDNRFNIKGISHDVGFKSKSSFYQAFKKFKGTTPLKYIKSNV